MEQTNKQVKKMELLLLCQVRKELLNYGATLISWKQQEYGIIKTSYILPT